MTTIQAIAKLMEMIDSRQDDMEPLMVLTKQIAEQEEAVAAQTSRGGTQFQMFPERPACESKYGLCE